MIRKLRRKTWLTITLLILVSAPIMAGCYGRFPMVNAVYEINEDISSNEVVDQIMFLVLTPVYAVGLVLDVLVFNLLEFWTGDKTVILTEESVGSDAIHVADASRYEQ